MTKEDAEQHAAVWKLADDMLAARANQETQASRSVELVAATLAASYLAAAVANGYETMARALS